MKTPKGLDDMDFAEQVAHLANHGLSANEILEYLDPDTREEDLVKLVLRLMMPTELPFSMPDSSEKNADPKRGEVVLDGDGITIQVEGYGDHCSPDGRGTPIMIENWEGELRLVVWADINQEDATHRISLEGAREDRRKTKVMAKLEEIAKGTFYARYGSTTRGDQVIRGPHVSVRIPVEAHPERLSLEEMDKIQKIINEHVCEVSQDVTFCRNPFNTTHGSFWEVILQKF
jgi:hypothetical protein